MLELYSFARSHSDERLMSRREHGAHLDYDSSTAHRELAVNSEPIVAVSETDLLVCVVLCEPSLLSHPVAPEDELVQIGRYVYLMPYAPFAYREQNASDSENWAENWGLRTRAPPPFWEGGLCPHLTQSRLG